MKIDLDARQPFPNLSTSITDISFLLTIFFVIAAVFIADLGIFISLPRADSTTRVLSPDEAVAIEIRGAGPQITVERSPTPLAQLAASVRALLPSKRNPVAVVGVMEGIPYQTVLDVVEQVKLGGISTFSIVVRKGAAGGAR